MFTGQTFFNNFTQQTRLGLFPVNNFTQQTRLGADRFILIQTRLKKGESRGKQCHTKTMMRGKANDTLK